VFGGPDGIEDLIGIFPGYFGAQFVYLADAVATGLASSDEESVLIVRPDAEQAA